MNTTFLPELIKLLKKNKDFPNYQAERRIDIFINLFLKEILTNYFHDGSVIEYVCPEFPLKKDDANLSTKLDYLCSRKLDGRKDLLFVELKTDVHSIKSKQIETYLSIVSWDKLHSDLLSIKDHTKYKGKYNLLLEQIKEVKFSLGTSISLVLISPCILQPKRDKLEKAGYQIQEEKKMYDLIHSSYKFYDEAKILFELFKDIYVFEIRRITSTLAGSESRKESDAMNF